MLQLSPRESRGKKSVLRMPKDWRKLRTKCVFCRKVARINNKEKLTRTVSHVHRCKRPHGEARNSRRKRSCLAIKGKDKHARGDNFGERPKNESRLCTTQKIAMRKIDREDKRAREGIFGKRPKHESCLCATQKIATQFWLESMDMGSQTQAETRWIESCPWGMCIGDRYVRPQAH